MRLANMNEKQYEELLDELDVIKSDANYLLIKSQKNIYEKLLSKKILVRKCDDFHGLDERFYRIAVRGREENNLLIDNLVTLIIDL